MAGWLYIHKSFGTVVTMKPALQTANSDVKNRTKSLGRIRTGACATKRQNGHSLDKIHEPMSFDNCK